MQVCRHPLELWRLKKQVETYTLTVSSALAEMNSLPNCKKCLSFLIPSLRYIALYIVFRCKKEHYCMEFATTIEKRPTLNLQFCLPAPYAKVVCIILYSFWDKDLINPYLLRG